MPGFSAGFLTAPLSPALLAFTVTDLSPANHVSEVEARPVPRSLLQQEAWGCEEPHAAPGVLPQPAAGSLPVFPGLLMGMGGLYQI